MIYTGDRLKRTVNINRRFVLAAGLRKRLVARNVLTLAVHSHERTVGACSLRIVGKKKS